MTEEPQRPTRAAFTAPVRRLALVAIVAGSVLVRVLYFLQLTSGPCAWQHLWKESDMYFFDRWARVVAAGDWLTDQALHPHVGWHKDIAEAYFAEHPEAAKAWARSGSPDRPPAEPWETLWDHWYAEKTFHQEPLYAYLVALTYKAMGPDFRWVFVWQMAFGVLTNVLVYAIARRHFGERVALLAGMGAVLCGPMVFYEMVLIRESLSVFAGVALVFLVDRALERGRWQSWLSTGMAFGVAILLKTTFVPLFLGVLAWMALTVGRRALSGAFLRNAVSLAGGVALLLAPAVARNLAVGAPAVSLSSVGPITFLFANAEDYPPDEGFSISKHASAILAKTDGRALPMVIETLKTHPGPGSYARQLWGKFGSLWHWYEKPNNKNFYYYRLHAPVLGLLPVTFFIIGPLSLVGLVLAAPSLREHVALYLLVLTTVAQLLIFYVLSRLRIPLVPALLPFAALTVVWIAERLLEGRWVASAAAAAGVVLLSLWTMRPLPPDRWLIRPADYSVPYETYWEPIEETARRNAKWREAADVMAESLRYEPDLLREIGPARIPWSADVVRLASLFARVHGRYAEDLRKAGDPEAAAKEERRADELLAAVSPSQVIPIFRTATAE